MYRKVFWTLWEKARVGWFERTILKHVYYHMWNKSPVQVWYKRQVLRACALWWPWGMGWGGRWKGRLRMRNTCTPMADSCQCMAKPLQYCKVISFQLKKKKDWLSWSPCSARDSQESYPTSQFKSINFWHSAIFMVQISHLYMITGKTIALIRWTFVSKVMSLVFNMPSSLFIAFSQGANVF